MAFNIVWGTGFEMGSVEVIDAVNQLRAYIDNSEVKTGVYSLRLTSTAGSGTSYVRINWTGLYLDFSGWIRPGTSGSSPFNISCIMDNGDFVEVRRLNTTTWDAYVDRVLVESGSISTTDQEWAHVQVRFYTADSGGYIQTRINGIDDIDYSGDTLPSGSTDIAQFMLEQRGATTSGYTSYVDDINLGDGGFPGDIRYNGIVPDGDSSVQWTPSTGSYNYALVDELPPSDDDYVSTGSAAYRDLYTMGDWSGTAKTAQHLIAWLRARKDVAEPRQLSPLIQSGGSLSTGSPLEINTSFGYLHHIVNTDPETGEAWTEDAINSILAGMETV